VKLALAGLQHLRRKSREGSPKRKIQRGEEKPRTSKNNTRVTMTETLQKRNPVAATDEKKKGGRGLSETQRLRISVLQRSFGRPGQKTQKHSEWMRACRSCMKTLHQDRW